MATSLPQPLFKQPRVLSIYDRKITFERDEISQLYPLARSWALNDPAAVFHNNIPNAASPAGSSASGVVQSDSATGHPRVQFALPPLQRDALQSPEITEPRPETQATTDDILPKIAKLSRDEEEQYRRSLKEAHLAKHRASRQQANRLRAQRLGQYSERLAAVAPHLFGPNGWQAQGIAIPQLSIPDCTQGSEASPPPVVAPAKSRGGAGRARLNQQQAHAAPYAGMAIEDDAMAMMAALDGSEGAGYHPQMGAGASAMLRPQARLTSTRAHGKPSEEHYYEQYGHDAAAADAHAAAVGPQGDAADYMAGTSPHVSSGPGASSMPLGHAMSMAMGHMAGGMAMGMGMESDFLAMLGAAGDERGEGHDEHMEGQEDGEAEAEVDEPAPEVIVEDEAGQDEAGEDADLAEHNAAQDSGAPEAPTPSQVARPAPEPSSSPAALPHLAELLAGFAQGDEE